LLAIAWRLVLKLADNAVITWLDNQIANLTGISSPQLSTVVSWAIPILLGILTLTAYYMAQSRFFNLTKAPPAQAKKKEIIASNRGDAQVARRLANDDDCLKDWGKLYEQNDEDGLRLRFLPDTKDQASDALLLICLG